MKDFTKWVEAWDAYRKAGLPVQGEHRGLPLSPRPHRHSRKHSLGIVPHCLPQVRHPHGHLHCVTHTGRRLPCRIVPYARPLRDGTRTGRIRHADCKNLGIGVHRLRRESAPTAPPLIRHRMHRLPERQARPRHHPRGRQQQARPLRHGRKGTEASRKGIVH